MNKLAGQPGQTSIIDYFDISSVCKYAETNTSIRTVINRTCGRDANEGVAPLLFRIYENAKKNSQKKSNRHDLTVKKFALALLILTGKAGYELLQRNLGDALPAYSTRQRMMGTKERMEEGKFYFAELVHHLEEWKAPIFICEQI